MKISFILPVLNESELIVEQLKLLQLYRQRGHEVLVIDGGSMDNTVKLATALADAVHVSTPGRAVQMNCGAEKASGDVLLFLHIDTTLPNKADQLILKALEPDSCAWGWFSICLSNPRLPYRIISMMMNLRSRISSVCTGDQALFVRRELFDAIGGFPVLPIMEDVAISKELRSVVPPSRISNSAVTSSRRWEKKGLVKTVLLMWQLRLLYFLGVSTTKLVAMYYPGRS
ncbi:MAG: glycosyl transferase [SAR86 cluster bacterium]|uniref:Glycosyl transferase n=1 Tax=SAR86 cluster bacterium TaxID=2030880 RepID=A0A2A5AFT1_9GAMM|nr:MAG: glycosyl transferase [SAR86 cluster bacterium]